MNKPIVIYGLTAYPVTLAHRQSYLWLCAQGNNVIVVPAIGHEFKLWALESYPIRKRNCVDVFGDAVVPLEEYVLGLTTPADPFQMGSPTGGSSVGAIREALQRFGHPVMAIDMMRSVRELIKRPHVDMTGGCPMFALDQLNATVATDDIRFAIGPDVNVDTWTGIEEIRAEFGADPFVRMPEIPNIRATFVREAIAAGRPWEHLVPEETEKLVKELGLFGWGAS